MILATEETLRFGAVALARQRVKGFTSLILRGAVMICLSLIAGTILAAFCFSSLGLVISAPPTDNPSNIMMLSTLIKFPLIFISGIFVPIGEMGDWKFLSYISPLTGGIKGR